MIQCYSCRATNKSNEALHAYNHSRKDGEYAEDAVCRMIDMYLQADSNSKRSVTRRSGLLNTTTDTPNTMATAAEYLLQVNNPVLLGSQLNASLMIKL